MQGDVFKALADPTRRQILDFLREKPRTTGELAARFEQSRFGVMKHLGVLTEAGLVTVRREGRKRWNHLNAVPLREMYERWLGPYQELWASGLLRLRDFTDSSTEPEKNDNPKEKTMADFHSFEIAQEITLKASPAKVWAALTTDIGKWWAYRVGEEGSTVHLEPRLGGRFEERWGDGEGVIWGEVVDLRKGKRLRLKGALGMSGAAVNDYVYELEEKDGGTLLKLTHHGFGSADPDTGENYRGGWSGLLEKYLVAWLDEGKTHDQLPKAE